VGRERQVELLRAYDHSDLSQTEFARREGLNFHTFVDWLQRRLRSAGAQPPLRVQALSLPFTPETSGVVAAAALEVQLADVTTIPGQQHQRYRAVTASHPMLTFPSAFWIYLAVEWSRWTCANSLTGCGVWRKKSSGRTRSPARGGVRLREQGPSPVKISINISLRYIAELKRDLDD